MNSKFTFPSRNELELLLHPNRVRVRVRLIRAESLRNYKPKRIRKIEMYHDETFGNPTGVTGFDPLRRYSIPARGTEHSLRASPGRLSTFLFATPRDHPRRTTLPLYIHRES